MSAAEPTRSAEIARVHVMRLAEALHRAVCSDDGDTCCWDGEDREHDGLCTDQHGVFHETGLEANLLALGVRPPPSLLATFVRSVADAAYRAPSYPPVPTDAGGRDE